MNDYSMEFIVGTLVMQALAYATGLGRFSFKAVIGGCILSLMLSVLDNVNPQIANGFSGMMFLTVSLQNFPSIVNKLGLSSPTPIFTPSNPWGTTPNGLPFGESGPPAAGASYRLGGGTTPAPIYALDDSTDTSTNNQQVTGSTATPQNSGGTTQT